MAVTGQNIVDKAMKYVGSGSSTFCKAYGVQAGTAWCCIFVWYIFKQCGASKLFMNGSKTAYVPTAQEWLHKNCEWVKMADAKPGDIVIFTWSGNGYNGGSGSRDHIGFIRKKGTASTAYTVEGNTNGGIVATRTRAAKWVRNIYRPKYSASSSTSTTKLKVDGKWGKDTTKRTQKVLGTTQDGIVSNQLTSCKKYLENCLTESWQFNNKSGGSPMVKALQKLVGATQDGQCGVNTVKKLQTYLNKKGYSVGTVDGYMGSKTVKGWQKYVNSKL